MVQPFFCAAFRLKFFTVGKTPQLLDQRLRIDDEGPASLIAAEAMQQFDRLPPP